MIALPPSIPIRRADSGALGRNAHQDKQVFRGNARNKSVATARQRSRQRNQLPDHLWRTPTAVRHGVGWVACADRTQHSAPFTGGASAAMTTGFGFRTLFLSSVRLSLTIAIAVFTGLAILAWAARCAIPTPRLSTLEAGRNIRTTTTSWAFPSQLPPSLRRLPPAPRKAWRLRRGHTFTPTSESSARSRRRLRHRTS